MWGCPRRAYQAMALIQSDGSAELTCRPWMPLDTHVCADSLPHVNIYRSRRLDRKKINQVTSLVLATDPTVLKRSEWHQIPEIFAAHRYYCLLQAVGRSEDPHDRTQGQPPYKVLLRPFSGRRLLGWFVHVLHSRVDANF